MLNEWIGRQERAEDEVALSAVRRLAALLDLPAELQRGDPLPRAWYVMLFGPTTRQSGLGPDGHPAKGQFLPPVPLPRRMFAGRRVSFHERLLVGEDVRRVSTIQGITPKQGRSGEMCFVTVRHEISGGRGLAVVEEQDIVYRGETQGAGVSAGKNSQGKEEKPVWSRPWTPDSVALFRFSAITYNGHRIHYDLPYTQETEGYPGLIVNGGLTTLMLWQLATSSTGMELKVSSSRNLKPLFVDRPVTLCGRMENERVFLWAVDDQGARALEAEVELA
ncbi:MAG TPA: MaoC family dehydratase N-terminal domain-containing protein [Burkholderiales bacterium]|nr:MaoC family dehydratase N-terminal domain-containing protein [Burkholderiales bacterium]